MRGHKLCYHTEKGRFSEYGSLGELEEQLRDMNFMRCNSCYLVNPKFIVSVKNNNVQVGNHVLQISRPRRAAFMAELADWFAGAGGGGIK